MSNQRRYIAVVKWRNQMLALVCLLAFAGLGILYFQHWVVQKPFGIVLFIGEGLAPSRIAATRVFAGGEDTPLAIESLPYSALLKNFSEDFATPYAASATICQLVANNPSRETKKACPLRSNCPLASNRVSSTMAGSTFCATF